MVYTQLFGFPLLSESHSLILIHSVEFKVFLHRLKTNIAFNLAILLISGMMLIDFVIIISVQKLLIKNEISKSYLFISMIEKTVMDIGFKKICNEVIQEPVVYCMLVLNKDMVPVYNTGKNCDIQQTEFRQLTREAIYSQKPMKKYFEETWGIFWKQPRWLIIAAPLFQNRDIAGGVGMIISLEEIYRNLRQIHHFLFIYVVINTFILTFIGLYRIARITVKPVHKLLKRSEDYREDSEVFFLIEQEEHNEFNQLSKSLNRMLKRISDDKEQLRHTVCSLEKANKDLKQAQRDIIRAEKLASVGRLSAGIAHEIGNPIAIVIGYLELLKRNETTEDEKKEFISRTENEISRINTIIRQLLDFSRQSSDTSQKISVHKIIEDVIDILRFQPLLSDIDLKIYLNSEKDMILADPNQLRQVFVNLIINAADAILSAEKGNGELILTSEVISNAAVGFEKMFEVLKICCIDNGPGIHEEHLGNIFDPFYTTKDPGKGTGLGLSVSFMIIESMGGKIEAVSEPEKGTTMILYLPICND